MGHLPSLSPVCHFHSFQGIMSQAYRYRPTVDGRSGTMKDALACILHHVPGVTKAEADAFWNGDGSSSTLKTFEITVIPEQMETAHKGNIMFDVILTDDK